MPGEPGAESEKLGLRARLWGCFLKVPLWTSSSFDAVPSCKFDFLSVRQLVCYFCKEKEPSEFLPKCPRVSSYLALRTGCRERELGSESRQLRSDSQDGNLGAKFFWRIYAFYSATTMKLDIPSSISRMVMTCNVQIVDQSIPARASRPPLQAWR